MCPSSPPLASYYSPLQVPLDALKLATCWDAAKLGRTAIQVMLVAWSECPEHEFCDLHILLSINWDW